MRKNIHPTCRKDTLALLKFISQIDLNYLDHITLYGWDAPLPNLYYLVDFFGLKKVSYFSRECKIYKHITRWINYQKKSVLLEKIFQIFFKKLIKLIFRESKVT